MSGVLIAVAGFAAMLVLIVLRMPVGLAMLVVGAAGYATLAGVAPLLAFLKTTPYYTFANYTLSVIPLFVLMGALAERGGLARALFEAAAAVIGHRRGGLASAVIAACAGFGAVCGSSVATTATFARAALPELLRYRCDPGFSAATVAAGGTLGILVPPSVVIVVYAISTEQNIAKLFMAALVPGLLATLLYIGAIAVRVRRNPALAPPANRVERAGRLTALLRVWPVALIALVVVGGIYGGVFTPTEAAAVGALATLLVGLAQGSLRWPEIRQAMIQTAETTAMIFLILLGAEVFNGFLALSRLPDTLAQAVIEAGLPAYGVLAALLLVYILLGAVMDELAMILLTLPVFFPVMMSLDFGLTPEETAIWFGILVLTVVGIGLTAPPIGLNVFVVSAIAREVPIAAIYRRVLPFLAADLVRISLLVAFPVLSLGLVRLLG
ncbi:TRAP transporter large permease [Blastochloris sulfoviridis]|nr:TRAP transporter large permease [Blastochloris sulfoviridis]